MTKPKILFIILLLFLTSRAKPFKESTTDNENTNQAITQAVTPSGQVNEKRSITFYIENDDILSISEFSRMYNPGENLFNNVRFLKEPDSDYVEKVRSKNIKTTLENPKLEEFNEESKSDENVDDTIVDSEKESRNSKSEGLSTETKELGSTTISIKGHGRSVEKSYEDDLEVPESMESTERYFKNNVSKDKRNRLDEIMPLIQSRRSLPPNEKLLLDTKGNISNRSAEIDDVDQDTKTSDTSDTSDTSEPSDVLNKKPNDQSKVENTSETPVVPQIINPDPAISDEQFDNPSPLLTGITSPADLKEISNDEITKFGDEYKPSNNLNKAEKIVTEEKTIDDFNSNTYENAYPYTPPNVKSMSRQSLTKQPNSNSLYSKLPQASRHPSRNRVPSGQGLGFGIGTILPNFNQQNPYLQNVGLYNLVPRTRRFFTCDHCDQQQDEHHMYIH